MQVGGGFQAPHPLKGFPDIFGYFPDGRGFAIEVKSKTGKVSDVQALWHARLNQEGVLVIVARSIEDVETALKEYLCEKYLRGCVRRFVFTNSEITECSFCAAATA